MNTLNDLYQLTHINNAMKGQIHPLIHSPLIPHTYPNLHQPIIQGRVVASPSVYTPAPAPTPTASPHATIPHPPNYIYITHIQGSISCVIKNVYKVFRQGGGHNMAPTHTVLVILL